MRVYRKRSLPLLLSPILGLAALSATAGCEMEHSSNANTLETVKDSLISKEWVVEDMNGKGIIDRSNATLMFAAGDKLSGRSFCNRYFASYTFEPNFSVGNIGQTKMACAPALMNQESLFTNILGHVNSLKITENGTLILSTPEGDSITAR